eukprot:618077-Prorocentrum_minimum.AAC.1
MGAYNLGVIKSGKVVGGTRQKGTRVLPARFEAEPAKKVLGYSRSGSKRNPPKRYSGTPGQVRTGCQKGVRCTKSVGYSRSGSNWLPKRCEIYQKCRILPVRFELAAKKV